MKRRLVFMGASVLCLTALLGASTAGMWSSAAQWLINDSPSSEANVHTTVAEKSPGL